MKRRRITKRRSRPGCRLMMNKHWLAYETWALIPGERPVPSSTEVRSQIEIEEGLYP